MALQYCICPHKALPALLLATLAAFPSCSPPQAEEHARRDAPVLQVETMKVTKEPFQQTLGLTGSLQADEQIILRPEMSGMVQEIHFDEGQEITKNNLILTLRNTDFLARLDRSKAQLKLADATATRLRSLIETQAVSRADVDEAEASLAIAQAEVDLAAAELAKTMILAPFDGVIGLREVSVGDYIDSNSAIASLRRLDPLRLEANIPERYQAYIRQGQEISFRIGGSPNEYAGIISVVESGIDPETRTIRLRAAVPNPDLNLLPGSFIEGQLKLDEIPDAILVPSLAVVPGLRDEIVYIVEDGQAVPRQIHIGFRTADRVYIASGLEEGDEIILSGILQMRPGLRVKPLENNRTNDISEEDKGTHKTPGKETNNAPPRE